MHARNSFENKIFWKRIIKNPQKSQLCFFFQTQSLLMCKVIKNKRSLELVTISLQVMKQVQKNSFISYILSDQVGWCNIKQLLSYFKSYICKFMPANSWHHKLFHFHSSFCVWKVWKVRGKITKIRIFWERKELCRWNKKTLFIVFEGLIIWWKNKKMIKNRGHKL